jgi:dethiobiotin synthetase
MVLTIEYLKGKKIPIRWILCNRYRPDDFMEQDNIHMIRELTGIPIIACVQADAEDLRMDPEVLLSLQVIHGYYKFLVVQFIRPLSPKNQ